LARDSLWLTGSESLVRCARRWGNWQWKLDSIDVETQTMEFGFGGFQDAHGGPVASNYFFAENCLQELDAPSEWYVDRHEGKVYFWPPTDGSTSDLVVSQLQTVLRVEGTKALPAHDNSVAGLTFAHTTTMFVSERYSVPVSVLQRSVASFLLRFSDRSCHGPRRVRVTGAS
jgi:hypothetical protein